VTIIQAHGKLAKHTQPKPVRIFPPIVLALHGSHVRQSFCPTRSVFERVGLPAVQGKCTTDLYETCSTEACTAGCTTDLYDRGHGP
jgi:hypothetical protein